MSTFLQLKRSSYTIMAAARLSMRRFAELFANADVRAQFAEEIAAAGAADEPDAGLAGRAVYRMIAKGAEHAASRAKARRVLKDADPAVADPAAGAAADPADAADAADAAPNAAAPAAPAGPALDEDQMRVCADVCDTLAARAADARAGGRLLVMAGPGAGKTTTLIETIVTALQRDPAWRILVLAFNVAAEDTVISRLKTANVRRIFKSHAFTGVAGGCAAMTFDKAANQIIAGSGTHDQRKELAGESLETSPELAGRWDMVVVDEAQDVTALEARIVEGIVAGSGAFLLAAGDPRQEVRAGAAWFSRAWAAGGRRAVLSRNYRSARRIVAALNDFSRAAFPSLHSDQVAVRDEEGLVRVLLVPGEAGGAPNNSRIGGVVGDVLVAVPAGDSYGIVPCSLIAWKMQHATLSACQQIHRHRPADAVAALTQDAPLPKEPAFLLGTAAKFKGTERPHVAVYGADREYIHRVSDEQVAKMVFVALSRARDCLTLVTSPLKRQRIKTLMEPFVSSAAVVGGGGVVVAGPTEALSPPGLRPVPVTGESLAGSVLGVSAAPFQETPWLETVRLEAPALLGIDAAAIAAFAGFMAEAHVAAAAAALAGVPSPLLTAAAEVVAFERDEYRGCQFFCGGGVQQVYVDPRRKEAMEAYLAELRACSELAAPYVHSAIKMTAAAGREWTLHSPLADADANAALAAEAAAGVEALRDVLEAMAPGSTAEPPRFWTAFMQPLNVCRAGLEGTVPPATAADAVSMRGELDMVWGGAVVELKHCAADEPAHERQLAAYMAALEIGRGVLYNTRRGEMRAVRVTDPAAAWSAVNARARAVQSLGHVQGCGHLVPFAVPLPPALAAATTAVFVDTETDGGAIIEVGAVAVSLADWSVAGTFEGRSCVEPLRGRPRNKCAAVHRLQWTTDDAAARARAEDCLRADFASWVSAVTPATPLFVHWAGSEKKLVGDAPALDARTVFRDWLRAKSGPAAAANGTGLGDAMRRLFAGAVPFAPHVALEDAIATAAVLMAVVRRGGVL
jgi:hypothetical protein